MAKFVQENEPRTLKYQLHREINKKTGVDDLVMLERCVFLPFLAIPLPAPVSIFLILCFGRRDCLRIGF
jgi:hypothetical protein